MIIRHLRCDELESWYELELREAFVPAELKPLCDMTAQIDDGRYAVLGLFDGDGAAAQLLAYATVMSAPDVDLSLLDYFGVTCAKRGSGLGSDMLSRLFGLYPGRDIIVEAESPVPGAPDEENALRLRRIAFYERCGFVPVYEMATCGMRFQALLHGTVPTAGSPALLRIMAEHKLIYGPLRTDVKAPLGPDEIPAPPPWMKQ